MTRDSRTRIDLRLDPLDAKLLDEEAAQEKRSLNSHIAYILKKHIDLAEERASVERKRARFHAVRESANG